jgi:hypothetical protein
LGTALFTALIDAMGWAAAQNARAVLLRSRNPTVVYVSISGCGPKRFVAHPDGVRAHHPSRGGVDPAITGVIKTFVG